jgi:hypothetical protein
MAFSTAAIRSSFDPLRATYPAIPASAHSQISSSVSATENATIFTGICAAAIAAARVGHRKIENGDVRVFVLDTSERRRNSVGDTYHDYAIIACQADGQAFAIEECVANDDDAGLKI